MVMFMSVLPPPEAVHTAVTISVSMRAWNRAKLLWGYLARRSKLRGAAGGVHRRDHRQVQPVLPDVPARNPQTAQGGHGRRGLRAAGARIGRHGRAHDADRPGRAVHGPADLRAHRILPSPQHLDAALDQRHVSRRAASPARVLDSPLEQITLSFDGAKKETFEFYRKGAKFEKVRDNFVRFARMKHERRSQTAGGGADGADGGQRRRGGRVRRASGARCRASTRCASRRTRPT